MMSESDKGAVVSAKINRVLIFCGIDVLEKIDPEMEARIGCLFNETEKCFNIIVPKNMAEVAVAAIRDATAAAQLKLAFEVKPMAQVDSFVQIDMVYASQKETSLKITKSDSTVAAKVSLAVLENTEKGCAPCEIKVRFTPAQYLRYLKATGNVL